MLPILMSMGLPAHIANGTNRVAIFFQSSVSTLTFLRDKKIDVFAARWVIIPSVYDCNFKGKVWILNLASLF
jgi:uncharacterized membrane protein YfcA